MVFLLCGTVTFGFSSVLIKLCAFPAGIVASLRVLLAGLVLAPFCMAGIGSTVRSRGLRGTLVLLVPGLLLGLHFQAWVTGVRMTTVAAATFIFATNPVLFAAAELAVYRRRLSWADWTALALLVAGGLWLVAANRAGIGAHLAGDGLCLLATVGFVVYLLASQRVSAGVPHAPYLSLVYLAGGILTLPIALARGEAPSFDWGNGGAWAALAALALLPTLVGHGSNLYAVRFFPPIVVSFFTLFEPILSSVAAFVVLGERPALREYPAYALLIASTALFLAARWAAARGRQPAPGRH
jgi:drug/metabolite transporter (DMT)-like permease